MTTPRIVAVMGILANVMVFLVIVMMGGRSVPCGTGWVVADKMVMPSAAEQLTDRLGDKVTEITGYAWMFRRKVVLVLTCADGRYVIEMRENP